MMIQKVATTKLMTLLLCALALAAITAGRANAACAPKPPIAITLPPLTFDGPANGPTIGQAIGSNWGGIMTSPNFYSGCLVGSIISIPAMATSGIASGITYTEDGVTYPIFTTSVPGIGVAVGIKTTIDENYIPLKRPMTYIYEGGEISSIGIMAKAKLVAIGPLKSGVYQIATTSLAEIIGGAKDQSQPPGGGMLMLNATTLTITARTCQMSGATTQNVPLLPVAKNQFSGVGSSAGGEANFSLTTLCDSGVNLYATMTDGSDPGNTGNILKPAEGTTASGVGVQILRNGLPISFGPDSSAKGNTNQWYIGTAGSGGSEPFTIPLKARYVQTAQTMVAGSVKARATVTFSYQ